MQLNKVHYGYSDNGNKYRKTNIGKKVGALSYGVIIPTIAYTKKVDGESLLSCIKNSVKAAPTTKGKILAGCSAAIGTAIGLGISAGFGALLGSGIDAIANKINAAKADKPALTKNEINAVI